MAQELETSPGEATLLQSLAFPHPMVHFLRNCHVWIKEKKRICRGKTRRVGFWTSFVWASEMKAVLTLLVSSWQQYLKKLHMQERAVEEVKLAIKPFYQRRDINKDEYKEILRKAVQKVGKHSTLNHELGTFQTGCLCFWRSGVPQQEWRDQSGEGGQPGESLRGQIQTCQETQERRGHGEDAGCPGRGPETLRQPLEEPPATDICCLFSVIALGGYSNTVCAGILQP